ncbi:hypothetical protein MAPG_06379 [Magnaporthiopsis poae ATCC 64411]|uniref:Uncharacterized protein n=1 Tax=Magnaporthiopsis poae (strain ATCC 64411 / 73-15) TaxID=644358 RepID=A0A0C4E1V7_MAGP6|nr:hypothetical protein MAPG_06379 [Magnaporthiopsis poae ATCC 64411]
MSALQGGSPLPARISHAIYDRTSGCRHMRRGLAMSVRSAGPRRKHTRRRPHLISPFPPPQLTAAVSTFSSDLASFVCPAPSCPLHRWCPWGEAAAERHAACRTTTFAQHSRPCAPVRRAGRQAGRQLGRAVARVLPCILTDHIGVALPCCFVSSRATFSSQEACWLAGPAGYCAWQFYEQRKHAHRPPLVLSTCHPLADLVHRARLS